VSETVTDSTVPDSTAETAPAAGLRPALEDLLAVLRDCLDNDDIGPQDNFFAMGGDSILALDVIAAARARGLELGLRDLLTQATVAGLADAATATAMDDAEALTPADEFEGLSEADRAALPDGVRAAHPATTLQAGMIYLAELARESKPYTDFAGVRVRGELDERALRAALSRLAARHRALRSSFDLDRFAEPLQLIWGEVRVPLVLADAVTEQQARDQIAAWREHVTDEGIDWDRPPLLRAHVVAGQDWFWLSVAVHHAIVDGWSFARLLVDLLSYYDAEHGRRPVGLGPVPATGLREFAALERAALADPGTAAFWRGQADAPPLLRRRDRFAPADPRASRFLELDRDRWTALRAVADDLRVPVKSLLLAAHGQALGQWAGRPEVVTGLVLGGRPEIEGADRLVGLFLNTLPVRLDRLTGRWAHRAAAALAAERTAIEYRRYPLAAVEADLGRPAFDVSFNFTHFHVYRDLAGLRDVRADGWWDYDKASLPMLVCVLVDEPGAGTGIAVSYDPDHISDDRAGAYLDRLDTALRDAAGGR
jgi:aryl carrier-like protein